MTTIPNDPQYNSILTVICRLTKYCFLIPCKEAITGEAVAELLVKHVFAEHCVPFDITSDNDTHFNMDFWKSFNQALSICLHFTTTYYPQANSLIERLHHTITYIICSTCIRMIISWSKYLPMVQFAINNAEQATTKVSPFLHSKDTIPTTLLVLSSLITSRSLLHARLNSWYIIQAIAGPYKWASGPGIYA
jgi:hypothetical protein